ncbi:MAG TPA: tetratricopeptide repeat protein [Acidobacteriaceae bacterium]
MTQAIGIRRWSFAIAASALLSIGGASAQTAQRVGATGQSKAGAAKSLNADAAAYAKLNAGQVDEAAAAFQAILATDPKDAGALAGMGQARILQGNYLGAVSFLEQAKQASPNDAAIATALDGARFHFLMSEGKDAQTAKDAVDAEKRYREALELRPATPEAVNALVNVLVLENKLSDAQDALSTAVAQTAAVSGHLPAELELQLAQLDIANSQPQLAYPIFLQVVQASPERVDAWSGLISALHLMGHDADAVAQERALPATTRAQLEATPGFEQMMTAMAAGPVQAAKSGEPSYTPFVPSAVTAAPVEMQTVPVATPAAPVATAPAIHVPQRASVSTQPPPSAANVPARPSVARPASAPSAPKPAAAVSQAAKAPGATAQAAIPSRPAKSAGSGAPLVTQPAARPVGRGEEITDTGEQQYPQPKTRPRAAVSGSNGGSSSQQ